MEELAEHIASHYRRATARAARRGADAAPLADPPADARDGSPRRRRWSRSSGSPPPWGDRLAPDRRRRGDGDQRLPVRPGARSRPGERAAARGRLRDDDVERILELVPLATHNQRGRGTLYVGTTRDLDAEELVGDGRTLDERADLRAAEAARRAVRRRARAPAAPLRRRLRAHALARLDSHPELDDGDFLSRASSTWRRSTRTMSSPSGPGRSGSSAASWPAPSRRAHEPRRVAPRRLS